ncbi:MAG: hypothetical protein B6I35_00675 [Anaerolineaceae bacterium 4572_32.2]|nr:MAG: hypothetical protein B6I35_00675 [Anaerolineaceae bacterium 4572_32.2]HEY73023.1 serine/threonine protein kinase [Thermoflexia bacterium]
MRLCEKCGFDANRDTARFCARCGQLLGSSDLPAESSGHVQVSQDTTRMSKQSPPPVQAAPWSDWDDRALLSAGATVRERYRVAQVLGKGGMGAVYLVEDLALYGKQWALKELLEHFSNQAERKEAIEQFQREVQMLVSLNHPNLPEVVNAFESGGRHYLVMEYVEGQTLQELLEATPDRRLPEEQALGWCAQICDVLNYLHSHDPPVIFRDLKPANVMITPQGQVKLIDFGVARLFDPAKGTDTLKMGTIGYAPPEQYSGQGQTTPRSDVYALGATLYDLLTGDSPEGHPFVFTPIRQLNRQISARTARAVSKAVELDPGDRFPSVDAMKAALLEQKRRRTLPMLLITLPLLALLAVGGWLLWQNGPWGKSEPTPTSPALAVAQATPSPTRPPTSTPAPTLTPTPEPPSQSPTPTTSPTPSPTPEKSPTPSATPQREDSLSPTPTPANVSQPATPSPLPPPPPGDTGRIFYTIEAGNAYYLASTDPDWSQGQIIGPIDYAHSTCGGRATAQTLEGETINLHYGSRCGIAHPKDCPSPNGEYKVNLWKVNEADYSVTLHQMSDETQTQSIYTGKLNEQEPLLWSPNSTFFYFTIRDTLHRASLYSTGYEPVIPIAHEPYLSPDGSMILYKQPVGSVGAYDLWVVNGDGSNPRNVTNAAETYKICARWGW